MMAKPAKAARMALAAALVLFSGVSSATIPGEISNGMSKQLRRSPGQKNKSAKGELEGGTAVLLETGYSRGRRERHEHDYTRRSPEDPYDSSYEPDFENHEYPGYRYGFRELQSGDEYSDSEYGHEYDYEDNEYERPSRPRFHRNVKRNYRHEHLHPKPSHNTRFFQTHSTHHGEREYEAKAGAEYQREYEVRHPWDIENQPTITDTRGRGKDLNFRTRPEGFSWANHGFDFKSEESTLFSRGPRKFEKSPRDADVQPGPGLGTHTARHNPLNPVHHKQTRKDKKKNNYQVAGPISGDGKGDSFSSGDPIGFDRKNNLNINSADDDEDADEAIIDEILAGYGLVWAIAAAAIVVLFCICAFMIPPFPSTHPPKGENVAKEKGETAKTDNLTKMGFEEAEARKVAKTGIKTTKGENVAKEGGETVKEKTQGNAPDNQNTEDQSSEVQKSPRITETKLESKDN
ncbi:hypothetical protein AAMO2058_000117400 [Amorphochlora amoebiformis]